MCGKLRDLCFGYAFGFIVIRIASHYNSCRTIGGGAALYK